MNNLWILFKKDPKRATEQPSLRLEYDFLRYYLAVSSAVPTLPHLKCFILRFMPRLESEVRKEKEGLQ